jgi:flagellar basal-body rod protein FlgB
MWDVTTHAAIAALDGLSRRGEVRANNVANAETPGFRAGYVEFESALSEALRRGDPRSATPTTIPTPSIVNANGNSVDLETELVAGIKDGLHRDAMTASFNFKVGNLRMAIGGRR